MTTEARDREELERFLRAFGGAGLGGVLVEAAPDPDLRRVATGPDARYGLDASVTEPDVWRIDGDGWAPQAPSVRAFFAQLIALERSAGEDVEGSLRKYRWATEGGRPWPAGEDPARGPDETQWAWFVRLGIAGADHALAAELQATGSLDGARERDHLRRFPRHVPALALRLQRRLRTGDRAGARATAEVIRALPGHRVPADLEAAVTSLLG